MNDKPNSNTESPLPAEDERVSAYLDGELTGAELAEFEQRMEADPAYLAAVDEMRQVSGAMKSLPELKLGSDFSSRVMEQALAAGVTTTSANAGATTAKSIDDSPSVANWRPYAYGLLTLAAATLLMLLVPGWNPFPGPNRLARTDSNADGVEQAASQAAPATALEISGEASATVKSKARWMDRPDFGGVADVKLQTAPDGLRYEETAGTGGTGMGGAGGIASDAIAVPRLNALDDDVDVDGFGFDKGPGAMGRPLSESVASADADLPLVDAPAAVPLAAIKMKRQSVARSTLSAASAPDPSSDRDEFQLATEAAQHREFIRGRMATELLGFAVPPAKPQEPQVEKENQLGTTGDQVARSAAIAGTAIAGTQTPASRPAVNQVVDSGVISGPAVTREMMKRDIALRPVAVVSLPAEANLDVFFAAANQHGIRLNGVERLASLASDASGDNSNRERFRRELDRNATPKFDDNAAVKNESDSEGAVVADDYAGRVGGAPLGELQRMRQPVEENDTSEESEEFADNPVSDRMLRGEADNLFGNVDGEGRAGGARDIGRAVGFGYVFPNHDLAQSAPLRSRGFSQLATPIVAPPVDDDERMRSDRAKNGNRVSESEQQAGVKVDPIEKSVKDELRTWGDLDVAEVELLEKRSEKSRGFGVQKELEKAMKKNVAPKSPVDSVAAADPQPAVAAGQYVLVEAPPAVINQLVASLQRKANQSVVTPQSTPQSIRPLRTWYFDSNEQAVASAAPVSGGGIASGSAAWEAESAFDFVKPVQQESAPVNAAAKPVEVRSGEVLPDDRSQATSEFTTEGKFSSRWLSINESGQQKVRVLFFIRSQAPE